MKIISSFSDYYDGVMKMGMDREVVYVRTIITSDLPKRFKLENFRSGYSTAYTADLIFLGYCGQIYRIYSLKFDNKHYVFFQYDQFREFMTENGLGSSWDFGHRRWWPGTYQKFEDYDTSQLLEIFHEKQVPLFFIKSASNKNVELVLNPKLKDLAFQKVKDPYIAYQDIFQYVSGVLNSRENDMVKISDKDKATKHGFDEWSFKKLPGGKKRRKSKK